MKFLISLFALISIQLPSAKSQEYLGQLKFRLIERPEEAANVS